MKEPLGRPRWEDNIKMDHKVIVYEDVDCIQLGQGGVYCKHGSSESLDSLKGGEFLDQLSDY
jgi:hypothetical protein